MNNENDSTPVSDDMRKLATSKRVTLAPINNDVKPEKLTETAYDHGGYSSPQTVIESETESTSDKSKLVAAPREPITRPQSVRQTKSHKTLNKIIATLVILSVSLAIALILLILL